MGSEKKRFVPLKTLYVALRPIHPAILIGEWISLEMVRHFYSTVFTIFLLRNEFNCSEVHEGMNRSRSRAK